MIKRLFFSLLIISTATHSMELVFYDHDLQPLITHQICNEEPEIVKNTIRSFSRTNITLYKYYKREETCKNIVRTVALRNNLSDSAIAQYFGYATITHKINCLFAKINSELTQEDLLDTWYLNSAIPCAYLNEGQQETLLLRAIKLFRVTATKQLLTAGIDHNFARSQNPLIVINDRLHYVKQIERYIYSDIVELLLKKNIHPDSRYRSNDFTLLHTAAHTHNRCLAHILLQYGADPYVTCDEKNAFDLERGEPKGWLRTMVDEIEKNKKS